MNIRTKYINHSCLRGGHHDQQKHTLLFWCGIYLLLLLVFANTARAGSIVSMIDEEYTTTLRYGLSEHVFLYDGDTPYAWLILHDYPEGFEVFYPDTEEPINKGDTIFMALCSPEIHSNCTDTTFVKEISFISHLAYEDAAITFDTPINRLQNLRIESVFAPQIFYLDSTNSIANPEPRELYIGKLFPFTFQLAEYDSTLCNTCQDTLDIVLPDDANLSFFDKNNNPIDQAIFVNGVATIYGQSDVVTDNETFSLQGSYYNSTPRITYDYNQPIEFTIPPSPQVLDASIFDIDGDGHGDSIHVTYDQAIADDMPDTIMVKWPGTEEYIEILNVKLESDTSFSIHRDFTSSLIILDSGDLRSTFIGPNDISYTQVEEITNMIGPVIVDIQIEKGFGVDEDSIFVTLSQELVEDTIAGPLLQDDEGNTIDIMGIKISNNTFVITSDSEMEIGDVIRLTDNTQLRNTNDITPSENNQGQGIELISKLPPISDDPGGFYSNNQAGKLDSISLNLLAPTTSDMLSNSEIIIVWKDNNDNIVQIHSRELFAEEENSSKIYFILSFSDDAQENLTAITDDSYGYGYLINHYFKNGSNRSDTTLFTLPDRINPVITSIWIEPAVLESEPDEITLIFSEDVVVASQDNPNTLSFQHKFIDYDINNNEIEEMEDNTLLYRTQENVPMQQRPSVNDSIFYSFVESVTDNNDNVVSYQKAIIKGNARIELERNNLASFNVNSEDLIARKAFEVNLMDTATDITYLKENNILGHMFNIEPGLHLDEDIVNPENFSIEFTIDYFSALGSALGSYDGVINCADQEIFAISCIEDPRKVLLRWNFKSDKNRFVSNGVYMTKITIVVVSGEELVQQVEYFDKWGVYREN